MGETWLTSDLHLGHAKVAELRGFRSVKEHDLAILNNIARKAQAGDDLWVLGDVALGGWREALAKLRWLPCNKHLVLGNHDRAHPMHSRGHAYVKEYAAVFDTVQVAGRIRDVLLSHFPYDGEGSTRPDAEDRHTQWRLRDEGAVLAHGHTHDPIKVRSSKLGTPMIHVGLDAWGLAPVTIASVLGTIDAV